MMGDIEPTCPDTGMLLCELDLKVSPGLLVGVTAGRMCAYSAVPSLVCHGHDY